MRETRKLEYEMSPDDLVDVRDMAATGDRLLEFISEQELRIDLWTPLLLAICRKTYNDSMEHMVKPMTFEKYLKRYAVDLEKALKSCDG